ncbi:MAG: hypothetical protein HY043_02785 [Verrucomicrobia bacterium]|nr:hypothetical protein [Verrucomicrobiota bacterium]
MKTLAQSRYVVSLAVALSFVASAHGQVLIVDNLAASRSISSSASVFDTQWEANKFVTDSHSYRLKSVSLLMDSASIPANSFQVEVRSDAGRQPGEVLAILSGSSNPKIADIYSYFTTSRVILGPDTPYWIVASVRTGNGEYSWNFASDQSFVGVGQLGGWSESINGGATWSDEEVAFPSQFSVVGEIVPEPSSCVLIVLGLAAIGFQKSSCFARYLRTRN